MLKVLSISSQFGRCQWKIRVSCLFLAVAVMERKGISKLGSIPLRLPRGKVECEQFFALRKLRRRPHAEFPSGGIFRPLLSLVRATTPRSAGCPSIFFLHGGGSSRISMRQSLPAQPQVASSPVAVQVPASGVHGDTVEKTMDLIAILFSVPRSSM